MNIAVIGAGNIGFAAAAYFCHHGHDVTIWSPSGASTRELGAGRPLRYAGVIEGVATPRVAQALAEAIAGAEVVFVALPGNAHGAVLRQLGQSVTSEQAVIICSLSSVSALVLDRELAARGIRATIAAFGTTPLTARKQSDREVRIMTLRTRLDMAALPVERGAAALALCTGLFGDRFALNGNVLTMSLGNVNPVAHSALALCNMTRIERGEDWPQYHYMTPYVARLIEALDRERMAVAAACGFAVRSICAHFHHSFDVPQSDLATMAAEIHRRRGGPPGPTDPAHRFIFEDVPFGLVFCVAIANIVGVPVPVTQSMVTMANALYGRAFDGENDVLDTLHLDALGKPELLRLVAEGYSRAVKP
jgi:opine dehydrogenase